MKTLIGEVLPFEFSEFMYLVKSFFGTKVFDLKEIIKFCDGLNGDLEMVAKNLGVDRAVLADSTVHLAGSDSLLTLETFLKLKEMNFRGSLLLSDFECVIHDLTDGEGDDQEEQFQPDDSESPEEDEQQWQLKRKWSVHEEAKQQLKRKWTAAAQKKVECYESAVRRNQEEEFDISY